MASITSGFDAECQKKQQIECLVKRFLREGERLPKGTADGDYLIWDEASQMWVPEQREFVESVEVVNTGSGTEVVPNQGPTTDNVVISARTLISSDLSISISNTVSGEVDITTGGTPPPLIGTVTTMNDTPTTLQAISLAATDRVYHLLVRVVARDTGGTDGGSFQMNAAFYNNAGVVQQIGTSTISSHLDQPWDANFTTSGDDALLVVTGSALTTINWRSIALVFISN